MLIVTILILFVWFGAASTEAASPKHILFLHAQTEDFPAHKLFENGFKKQMQLAAETAEYSYDYLELTKFSPNPRYPQQLASFLKQKYVIRQPDLVVTHLGPAADFALKYGREIFPKAQFLLAADEVEGVSNHALPPGFGGVTGIFDIKNTIGLILQLQPDVRKIYVVIGDSERERQTMASFRRDVASMSAQVEFVYLNAMPLPQMVETVRNLREKAAVMYMFVFKDVAGNVFIPANEVKTFSDAANVPIYIPYAVFMGRGAVGGYLMSTEILGMKAAEQSLARLQAQGGPSMPIQVQNAEYQFDWRALKRWGISESKLPPGSKVLFKELTVWEQYRSYIIGGTLLIALLSLLSGGLLFNRTRLRKAKNELIRLNAELESKVSERTIALSNSNAELEQENETRKRVEAELRDVNENLESKVEERIQEVQAVNEELTAQNEEMQALNHEIQSMNEEISVLNQNLTGLNEDLEQRVAERTSDLTAVHQELTAQYEELQQSQDALRRSAELQAVLREIAEAAAAIVSLDELYAKVHRCLAMVLPSKNFMIVNIDEAAGEIIVPYCADEINEIPRRRPIDKGLSEYVLRLGKSVYLTPVDLDRLSASGEYTLGKLFARKIRHYLGAPLIDSQGGVFGLISLALREEEQAFQAEDIEVLSIVAAQLSVAIERIQVGESLIQSETLQKSILRAAPVGIGLVKTRVMQSANEKLCIMTGYAEAELVGQSSRMLYPSQEEYEFVGKEKYRQITACGTGTVETKWQKKDGTIIDVLLSSTPLALDDLDKGVTFSALDITNRKRAETELSESEARYRAVIEQAPDAILLCDPYTYEVLEANPQFAQQFGYDLLLDAPLNMFDIVEDSRDNMEALLETIRREGFLPAQRRTLRHKNGTLVIVERSAKLVHIKGRSLNVMTLRNVSDEVRQEQAIRRDAAMATRVQAAMLKQAEASVHLDIATIFEPSSYVGGDMYFMDWRYGGNTLRGFLVDAAGHGLATALHTSAMHVLLREINDLDLPLPEQMRWLNQRAGQYFDEETFAGAVGFELDLQLRQLRWCCAGMPLVWLATRDQQGMVNCPGMYLGICSTETFEMHTTPISAGDSVCFMTDGLSEIIGLQTEMHQVGFAEMVSLLKRTSLSGECRDDATAVCIQVKSLPDSSARTDGWPRILRFNGYGDYQRLKGEMGKILTELTGKEHSMQEVAIHEALANAMECRDGVPRQHRARLRFNKVGNRLIVRVKTSRIGFAGNAILKRLRSQPEDIFSFGEDASMGRGIPLMLSIADKMTYNSEGTEVLLAWKL
jgi:PAS domain S-box-containing protein